MASAQLLKVTNTIDNRVEGIADNVLVVDNRVAGVDDRVAGVDERLADVNERVAAVDDRVKDIDDGIKAVDDKLVAVFDGAQHVFNQHRKLSNFMPVDGKETRGVIDQMANDIDHVKRSSSPNRIHVGDAGSIILTENRLQQGLRRWLSPQDSSTNHNIACNAHYKGTTTWFFEGTTYNEWKSTGPESLLWIHGKRVPCPILPPDAT